MAGNIWEGEIFRAKQLDRRSFVQSIVLFTHKASVLNGFMTHVVYVLRTHESEHGTTFAIGAVLTVFVQMIPT